MPPSQQKPRRMPERCGGGAAPPPQPGGCGASSPRPSGVSRAVPTQSAARKRGTGRSPPVTCGVTPTQNRMNYRRRASRWCRMRKALKMPSPALQVKRIAPPGFQPVLPPSLSSLRTEKLSRQLLLLSSRPHTPSLPTIANLPKKNPRSLTNPVTSMCLLISLWQDRQRR